MVEIVWMYKRVVYLSVFHVKMYFWMSRCRFNFFSWKIIQNNFCFYNNLCNVKSEKNREFNWSKHCNFLDCLSLLNNKTFHEYFFVVCKVKITYFHMDKWKKRIHIIWQVTNFFIKLDENKIYSNKPIYFYKILKGSHNSRVTHSFESKRNLLYFMAYPKSKWVR